MLEMDKIKLYLRIDGTTEDEMLTVSVLPNSTYWIFTGMFKDSTAPKAYDLSICGATFTPP